MCTSYLPGYSSDTGPQCSNRIRAGGGGGHGTESVRRWGGRKDYHFQSISSKGRESGERINNCQYFMESVLDNGWLYEEREKKWGLKMDRYGGNFSIIKAGYPLFY